MAPGSCLLTWGKLTNQIINHFHFYKEEQVKRDGEAWMFLYGISGKVVLLETSFKGWEETVERENLSEDTNPQLHHVCLDFYIGRSLSVISTFPVVFKIERDWSEELSH